MLMRIDDSMVIKADRYCFLVCEYRGMTKFPGGVTPYSKPIKYCGDLYDVGRVVLSEGHELTSDFGDAVRADYKLHKWLSKLNVDDIEPSSWLGADIKYDKDCYKVKVGSYTTYHNHFGYALRHCWSIHTRENSIFGGDHSEFMDNYDGASEEEIKKFLDKYESNYTNPLIIVDEAKKFSDEVCQRLSVEFEFDDKYPSFLIDKEVVSGKK